MYVKIIYLWYFSVCMKGLVEIGVRRQFINLVTFLFRWGWARRYRPCLWLTSISQSGPCLSSCLPPSGSAGWKKQRSGSQTQARRTSLWYRQGTMPGDLCRTSHQGVYFRKIKLFSYSKTFKSMKGPDLLLKICSTQVKKYLLCFISDLLVADKKHCFQKN